MVLIALDFIFFLHLDLFFDRVTYTLFFFKIPLTVSLHGGGVIMLEKSTGLNFWGKISLLLLPRPSYR